EASIAIRELIERRIEEGASDERIRDELAAAYGEQVLLTPRSDGVSGLVWAVPVVVLVLAFAGLAWAFVCWRGGGAARATEADRALVEQARRRSGEAVSPRRSRAPHRRAAGRRSSTPTPSPRSRTSATSCSARSTTWSGSTRPATSTTTTTRSSRTTTRP